MPFQFDAVYENGVLRPLAPVELSEHEHVIVSVIKAASVPGRSRSDVQYIERIKNELRTTEEPSNLGEVRNRLSKIPGSMAAEIVADRGER
jgi:predicted DNA-binding antitoxin AbrB/MazE fold protein